MKTLLYFVLFTSLLCLFTACSTIRPLSETRTFNGNHAKDVVIVVHEAYSYHPPFVTHTLPAGTYIPIFEDDDGIYFKSPNKHILGGGLTDGGLYLKTNAGYFTEIYECFYDLHSFWTGGPLTFKLPSDFKFIIENSQK